MKYALLILLASCSAPTLKECQDEWENIKSGIIISYKDMCDHVDKCQEPYSAIDQDTKNQVESTLNWCRSVGL